MMYLLMELDLLHFIFIFIFLKIILEANHKLRQS